jgi:hypothetical protein
VGDLANFFGRVEPKKEPEKREAVAPKVETPVEPEKREAVAPLETIPSQFQGDWCLKKAEDAKGYTVVATYARGKCTPKDTAGVYSLYPDRTVSTQQISGKVHKQVCRLMTVVPREDDYVITLKCDGPTDSWTETREVTMKNERMVVREKPEVDPPAKKKASVDAIPEQIQGEWCWRSERLAVSNYTRGRCPEKNGSTLTVHPDKDRLHLRREWKASQPDLQADECRHER